MTDLYGPELQNTHTGARPAIDNRPVQDSRKINDSWRLARSRAQLPIKLRESRLPRSASDPAIALRTRIVGEQFPTIP